MEIKQVICVRKDLNMRKGKMMAQAAHAAMSFMSKRLRKDADQLLVNLATEFTDVQLDWIDGSFKKVVLQVQNEQEMFDILAQANSAGLECHLIEDNGLTEFHGIYTPTCIAIGPDYNDKIDPITGHLKLW